jgi:tripartite ATP-independent transporter DctM subunit
VSSGNVNPTTSGEPAPLPLRLLHSGEEGLINLVFLVMSALPVLEVLSRKIIGRGITSSQTIVQNLTLWAGFLGALLATREGKHLSLSTAELLPEGRPRRAARVFTHAVAGGVTSLLAYASTALVLADSKASNKVFGSVPQWVSEAIMPIALVGMAVRLVLGASPHWKGRAIAAVAALPGFVWMLSAIVTFGEPGGLGFLASLEPSPALLVWPLAILILTALLAGAPIYVAMSGLAMLLFWSESTPVASVPTETLRLVISPTLPAIPLLTAAGFILGEGGAAQRLVRVYRAFLGWIPGGLAVMVCFVCAIFTAFTGGSGVTILALGGLVYPILREEKYPEGFSLGLVTASGSLGLLFPPSLPVILYGVVAQVPDVNRLYYAGLLPGALMIVMVCAYGVFIGVRSKAPTTRFSLDEALKSLWLAKWELGLPIFVALSILRGWATIVESAALACVYTVIVEVIIFKDIHWKKLPHTVVHGATLVGSVLIVLGVALGLTSYLVDADIPAAVIAWVKAHIHGQVGFLLALNVMLLVLGSVLEIYSAIVILAPLVAPLGVSYGVDPIHLAIVFLANLELGFLFPPVGLNLFLSSSRFNKPLPQLYKNAFPFLCIMAAGVLLITYVPAMTNGFADWIEKVPAK